MQQVRRKHALQFLESVTVAHVGIIYEGGDGQSLSPRRLKLVTMDNSARIEQERAAVLAGVLARQTSNWRAFGLSSSDRQYWQRQGIPRDKAHWAAILRDLNSVLPFAVRGHSVYADRPKVTVLEALQQGKPGARIAYQLTKRRGVPDPTPAPVRAIISPRTVQIPVQQVDRSSPLPATMGHLLDLVVARANDEIEALKPIELVERQAKNYLASGGQKPERLLLQAAESFGVYEPGEELDRLAACWANPESQVARSAASARVFSAVGHERHMYFLTRECSRDIQRGVEIATPLEHELPSPSGVAWFEEDSVEPRPAVILAWSCAEDELAIVRTSATALLDRLERDKATRCAESVVKLRLSDRTAESLSDGGDNQTVGMLWRLSKMYRSRQTSRSNERGGDSRVRIEAGRRRSPVVIRYRAAGRSRSTPDADQPRQRVLNDIRWKVRGHWRNQWYPGEGAHRPIWIAEHDAGHSPDAETVSRDIVTKLTDD